MNTTHKNKTYRFEIIVIDNNTDNLLSRDTAYKMGLVTAVVNVNRCLKGDPVKITLRENMVPYCTPTAWRISFPILPKVIKKPQRFKEDDIIEKVTKPTDWWSFSVPYPPQKKTRRCQDMLRFKKKLNSAVKREHFMLPNISPKLRGSRIFSKLDAASGFNQIPLDEESRLLMTFITPIIATGVGQAELLMGRKMKTILPSHPNKLKPK